jgi:hypothetical protein
MTLPDSVDRWEPIAWDLPAVLPGRSTDVALCPWTVSVNARACSSHRPIAATLIRYVPASVGQSTRRASGARMAVAEIVAVLLDVPQHDSAAPDPA